MLVYIIGPVACGAASITQQNITEEKLLSAVFVSQQFLQSWDLKESKLMFNGFSTLFDSVSPPNNCFCPRFHFAVAFSQSNDQTFPFTSVGLLEMRGIIMKSH